MPDPIPPPVFAQKPPSYLQGEFKNRVILDDEPIKELCYSLIAHGFLQPIGAVDYGDYGEQLYGGRRMAAYRYGQENGLAVPETIPMLLYSPGLTQTQRRIITNTENLQRLDLTPPEIFRNCDELMVLNPDWCLTDLSRHLNKSKGTITKYMAPKRLEPAYLAAFLEGKFGFDAAYDIAKSPVQSATFDIVCGGGSREERRATKPKKQPAQGAPPPDKFDRCPILFPEAMVLIKSKKGKEPLTLEATKTLLKDALAKVETAIGESFTLKTAMRVFADTKDKAKKVRKKREKKVG